MTIKIWLDNAAHDAERRGLAALRPLLESLAQATSALRTADWNADATGEAHDGDTDRDPSTGSGPPRAMSKRESPRRITGSHVR